MFSWFLNPWMLWGGLAIASPILIHLLNKRKFKIVQWAAMDFLFDADKKNRRRVELENFILLALRCLAMLLLAFLLARPFLPSALTQLVQQAEKYQRIFVIDDSLSQRVLNSQLPALELAKQNVNELLGQLTNTEQSENWVTVFLTSRPEQPILANEPLTTNSQAKLVEIINDIQASDGVADYEAVFSELNRYLLGQRDRSGQVIYCYSDLRQRDWIVTDDPTSDSAPNQQLNQIANNTLGCFLIDVGSPQDDNLAVIGIRPDSLLTTNRTVRFQVTIANLGSSPVSQARVLFQINQGQPQFADLANILPGETEEVSFLHFFDQQTDQQNWERLSLQSGTDESLYDYYAIRAEIDRQAMDTSSLAQDQLIEDSSALFAAWVSRGISVLLVDGDPSASRERSETHYLRSLQLPGTGLKMDVITAGEFETIPLSQYQVIFLCNVDEFSSDRIVGLDRWVHQGGGLVIMPGNRVRAETFNRTFYLDGAGLAPLQLTSISGSPTMARWVNFDVAAQVHPALRVVVDSDATSLSNVDIFSWWQTELNDQLPLGEISIPVRFTDDQNSSAMADRRWGSGRVVMFTIPADGDWTMWPSSPTFPPVMIDLIDYLYGSQGESANLRIGGDITLPIDLARYQRRVALLDPNQERIESIARPFSQAVLDRALAPFGKEGMTAEPVDDSLTNGNNPISIPPNDSAEIADIPFGDGLQDSDTPQQAFAVQFTDLKQRGFYSVELTTRDGENESVLFSVNYDPRESDLTRLEAATMGGDFFDEKVKRLSPDQLMAQTLTAETSEIWPVILILLMAVLISEQFLGWWWGRKR